MVVIPAKRQPEPESIATERPVRIVTMDSRFALRAPRNDGQLHRHPAVNEMSLTRYVACLVAGEKEGQCGDFARGAEPAHRLA